MSGVLWLSVAQPIPQEPCGVFQESPMHGRPFIILILLVVTPALAAEKSTAIQLIELAKSNAPALRNAIAATLDAKDLKEGTAWIAHGPDFSSPPKRLQDQSFSSTELLDRLCRTYPALTFGTPRPTSNLSENCTRFIT
jgi:hypothetical protein